MIFTDGIFKGRTMAEYQKISAVIFILSLFLGYYLFKKIKNKPYDDWFFKGVAIPLIPTLIVAFACVLYDAPVKIINKATGSAIEAKNMEDGRKILDFVQEKEKKASLEATTKMLYRN